MDILSVKKDKEIKDININIRITKGMKKWIDKNRISPTKVFIQTILELMKNENNKD